MPSTHHRPIVAALGFTAGGVKVPLGVWQGSTENAAVCTSLLNYLVERGLRLEHRILCVIDGGKGLRKALRDVLGDNAVVQRCQVHKRRNVLDQLGSIEPAFSQGALFEFRERLIAHDMDRRLLERTAEVARRSGRRAL